MSRWPTIYVGQPDEPDVVADADEDPDDEDTGPASPDVVLLLGFDPDEDEPTENFDPSQPRDDSGKWADTEGTQAEADREVKRTAADVKKIKAQIAKVQAKLNPAAPIAKRLAQVNDRIAELQKQIEESKKRQASLKAKLRPTKNVNPEEELERLLAEAKQLLSKADDNEPTENFDPAQPRDPDGKWTTGGGSSGMSDDAIEEKIDEYSERFEDDMFFEGRGMGRWFYPIVRSMIKDDPKIGYRDVAKAVKAVRNYVSGSHDLNTALRRATSIPKKHQAILRGLGALEKAPPGKTLYRGLALPEDRCKALFQKGALIQDRAVLSTSESKKCAEGFADSDRAKHIPVLMTLTSGRPTGRYIPRRLADSMWGNEKEVVFPPRSKIKIRQVRYNKSAGRYEVKGTIL